MKKFLTLTVAAVAFVATQASAYDIIHPFYGPSKGEVDSTTSYDFTHSKYRRLGDVRTRDAGVRDEVNTQALSEELAYGITDNWTVYGEIGREWGRARLVDENNVPTTGHTRTDNWWLGTSYNFINNGKHFLQGYIDYSQYRRNAESGDEGDGGLGKFYSVYGTYGYNFDCVTPYVKVGMFNTLNQGNENDMAYVVYAGAYKKLTKNLGTELGLDYIRYTGNEKNVEWDAVAKVSYMFTDRMALQLKGHYMLHDDNYDRERSAELAHGSYGLGADFKVTF